ncbi:MAG: hypothetical protein WDZ89_01160 [Gemmatimonadota bacterium]
MRRKKFAPRGIARFDSASAMVRTTARALHGRDFPVVGMRLLAPLMNRLPRASREVLYALSGAREGIPSRKLALVDSERLAAWAVGEYPDRQFPAVMIGSSNGAAVHLATALGIPWLPQTLLVPVRRPRIHPDDMRDDLAWGKENGRRLLDANPDIQLHQVHDPNQDRMMIRRMSRFRTKRLRLGDAYERFLSESLEPGGTIFLVECEARWPAIRVGERHLFQIGAMGGLEAGERLEGSERVSDDLRHPGSHRWRWAPPEPDGTYPEAEWGFEPALRDDVERFAEEKGFRVRRIAFELPEDLSPLVADLFRWWYRQRRIDSCRLIASSFLMLEPRWTLRTGSVPFWCTFAVETSVHALEEYLDRPDAGFDEIGIMLLSHGTEAAGVVPMERWRSILGRARRKGFFIGVAEEEFPLDFARLARYHGDMKRIPSRYPMPGPLTLAQFDRFLAEQGDRYEVRWPDSSGRREGTPSAGRFAAAIRHAPES